MTVPVTMRPFKFDSSPMGDAGSRIVLNFPEGVREDDFEALKALIVLIERFVLPIAMVHADLYGPPAEMVEGDLFPPAE